jgi:hypothetical protein
MWREFVDDARVALAASLPHLSPPVYADRAGVVDGTPAAKWREAGKPDPHGSRYNCERAALCGGKLTDDEIANVVFMDPNIGNLTAAKDRIRWLSRSLEAALAPAPPSAREERLAKALRTAREAFKVEYIDGHPASVSYDTEALRPLIAMLDAAIDDTPCPICRVPLRAEDICATDIEMGVCHAACLEGSPTVDLETGEPSDGPMDIYRYSEVASSPAVAEEAEPSIEELVKRANERFAALTPEQQARHWQAQRESWVRGQVGMGGDADEARERAAPVDAEEVKPAGWFNPLNEHHGYQQVAKEFEGAAGTIPLYTHPPPPRQQR